jgi:hypothetical protein
MLDYFNLETNWTLDVFGVKSPCNLYSKVAIPPYPLVRSILRSGSNMQSIPSTLTVDISASSGIHSNESGYVNSIWVIVADVVPELPIIMDSCPSDVKSISVH